MAAALAEEVEASLAKGNNSFSVGEGLYLFLLSYVRLCLTVRGSDVCLLSHSRRGRKHKGGVYIVDGLHMSECM